MKIIIVTLSTLTTICSAAISSNFRSAPTPGSVSKKQHIPILSQDQDVSVDGSWRLAYETGNGISVQEKGALRNGGGKDGPAEEVQGSFQYTADDGTPISLSYVANEFGYQPSGAHLPQPPVDTNTPPPTPPAILKALEWIKTHPYVEPQQQGKRF